MGKEMEHTRDRPAVRSRRASSPATIAPDEPDADALAKLKSSSPELGTCSPAPLAGMTTTGPIPQILTLGPDFYDPVEPAQFPQMHPALPQRALGGARRARPRRRRLGGAFLPLRAAARQPRRSRWRFAITAISSACTIRRSATAAASPSPSFATIATACSTSAPRARARRPTAATPTAG